VVGGWIRIWSVGGIIATGEDKSTGRETHASATLSTTNPTYTGLALCLKYGTFYSSIITILINKRRATFNNAKVVTFNLDQGSATSGPATLYYAARGHTCKSRIHYRHSAIIYAVRLPLLSNVRPTNRSTVPGVALCHKKMLEILSLDPELEFILKLVAPKSVSFLAQYQKMCKLRFHYDSERSLAAQKGTNRSAYTILLGK